MVGLTRQPTQGSPLPVLEQPPQATISDQVFEVLQQRILRLELPPLARLSESDVASQMGVSRQPVREAFKRLARLGYLTIRPQSRTTVSLISEEAVLRARFIRLALEVQTCREACKVISKKGIAALKSLIEDQRAAVAANDREKFHYLDDRFHQMLCQESGVGYVWEVISEHKGHMDRVRMLSLTTTSQKQALREHIALFNAIQARDVDVATATMTNHLSRILLVLEALKEENHGWFTESCT